MLLHSGYLKSKNTLLFDVVTILSSTSPHVNI